MRLTQLRGPIQLVARESERFLGEHVLSRLERLDREVRMRPMPGRDDDSIDAIVGDHCGSLGATRANPNARFVASAEGPEPPPTSSRLRARADNAGMSTRDAKPPGPMRPMRIGPEAANARSARRGAAAMRTRLRVARGFGVLVVGEHDRTAWPLVAGPASRRMPARPPRPG